MQLKFGGDEALQELYKQELIQSIKLKKAQAKGKPDAENVFLNSLTQPEYVIFVENQKNALKWEQTGLQSEILADRHLIIDEEMQVDETAPDEFSVEELREQFKVFKDPTYQQFIQIVGTEYSKDLPLFAQLYILKETVAFKTFYYNQLWVPYLVSNIAMQLAFFVFQKKFMFHPTIKLISWKRIFGLFFV